MSNLLDPEIIALFSNLSDAELRQAALRIAEQAVRTTNVQSSAVDSVLQKNPTANSAVKTELEQLAAKIEEPYINSLEEDGSYENDQAFEQARALTSLSCVFDEDIRQSMECVVYEAQHAGVETEAIKQFLQAEVVTQG